MKNFLATFIGTPQAREKSGWDALSPAAQQERAQAGIKAWHGWMAANRESIVDSGGPLGKTKRISGSGIADTSNNLAGYVVVKAESHDAAARLFENHPHFSIFPGEGVEIMECLPIPGA
jgi:hypothetical protein